MVLPFPISASQTDAKSPVDQQLMDALRLNQASLDATIDALGTESEISFKVNGAIYGLRPLLSQGAGKKLDGANIPDTITLTKANLFIQKGGTSGSTEVDVFRSVNVSRPIISIAAQYRQDTQGVGRLGSTIGTQSISLVTPKINTQTITFPKAAASIFTIVLIEAPQGSRVHITFTGGILLDSDYSVGDTIEFAGASNGVNNGKFTIENINYDGLPSVVINNPAGVVQSAAAGTGQLMLLEYTYVAAVDTEFFPGEAVLFSSHGAVNDGFFTIYKINQAGNNIWIKHGNGSAQGAPAGDAQCLRWVFTTAAGMATSHYIVGEKAEMSAHANGGNNGQFPITAVNQGGNNLVVYSPASGTQAGVGGNINTLRWLYAQPVDPTTNNTVGDTVDLTGHGNGNSGQFEIKVLNRNAVNNIEVYNETGLTQGVIGKSTNALMIVNFDTDYSADFLVDSSLIKLEGTAASFGGIIDEYLVKEINRGGNNIVIFAAQRGEQPGASGRVAVESRSIFNIKPIITVNEENQVRNYQVDSNATFVAGSIPAGSILTLDVTQIQEGLPEGLSLTLS